MKITEPGFYDLHPMEYHADPCPEASLSSSIARVLIDRTPAHARVKHPRLNPDASPEAKKHLDMGSAVHALALGAGPKIHVVKALKKDGSPAENYQAKEAAQQRDEAYQAGHIPLLPHDYERAVEMAAVLGPRLETLCPAPHKSELVMIWREGPIWCRTMIDRIREDFCLVVDAKTTGAGARTDEITRRFFNDGLDIQAAFIERGLDALHPETRGRRRIIYQWMEDEPPFALAQPLEVPEAVLHIARRKVMAAIQLWQRAMTTGEWPAYPSFLQPIEAPAWAEAQWLAREIEDEQLSEVEYA